MSLFILNATLNVGFFWSRMYFHKKHDQDVPKIEHGTVACQPSFTGIKIKNQKMLLKGSYSDFFTSALVVAVMMVQGSVDGCAGGQETGVTGKNKASGFFLFRLQFQA